jgi:O-antigen/teichoic acid export membrane protein
LTSFALISGALGLSLGAGDLLKIMSDPAFHPAAKVVPIVLLAYIVQCWTNYCRLGLLANGQTGRIAASGFFGVITATAGYLLLIPPLGGMGAALTTLAAFAVKFLIEYIRSNELIDMGIPWLRVGGILFAAAITLTIGHSLPVEGWFALGLDGLIVLVFMLAVFSSPLINSDERGYISRLIRGEESS